MLIARLVPDICISHTHSHTREPVLYTDLSTRPYRQGPLQLQFQFQLHIVDRHYMWRLLLVLGSCCHRSTILISHKYFYDTGKRVCRRSPQTPTGPTERMSVISQSTWPNGKLDQFTLPHMPHATCHTAHRMLRSKAAIRRQI